MPQMKIDSPSVLVADDDADIRLSLALLLSVNGYAVIEVGTPADILPTVHREQPNLILLDMNFSRDTTSGAEGLSILSALQNENIPVILMTAWGSIDLAVQGLKNGACDFFEKPWNKDKLLNSIAQQIEQSAIKQEHAGYRQLLSSGKLKIQEDGNNDWVCQSQAMQDIENTVAQISKTDANVLILGENGTGKSLLAQRIHRKSARHQCPFVSVNMAAIPDNLFESELFGHQKGAFTDAKQTRIGRFELADKGTLFFDEVGSLPVHLQAKLLRVLESGEYEVLGSSKTQLADVRLISATNANLAQLVDAHQFRQDLLYRLNTIVITIPSLKERTADIAPLVEKFILKFCTKYKKPINTISTQALNKLTSHAWPGNIRELSHTIERAVLMTSTAEISSSVLLLDSTNTNTPVLLQPLEQAERQLIEKAMAASEGNIIDAAKILNISRNALYRRIEKFNPSLLTKNN